MGSSRKVDRLDDAFLFIISLVGLLFTIIQIYMEGISGLIEISPLLFLGVLLPFYIGYLRGAISIDSVIERIRGWVYLAVGISTYIAIFLARIYPYLYFLFIILAFFSTYFLERWFNTIFEIEDDISNLYAFSGTTISSFSLAFSSYSVIKICSELLSQEPSYSALLLFEIWSVYVLLIISIIMEKLSRNVIGVKLPLSQQEIEKRRKLYSSLRQLASAFFIFGEELLLIVFTVGSKITFFWIQAMYFGMLGLGLALCNIPIFVDIFLIASMIFATFGLYLFLRIKEIDFSKIRACLVLVRN